MRDLILIRLIKTLYTYKNVIGMLITIYVFVRVSSCRCIYTSYWTWKDCGKQPRCWWNYKDTWTRIWKAERRFQISDICKGEGNCESPRKQTTTVLKKFLSNWTSDEREMWYIYVIDKQCGVCQGQFLVLFSHQYTTFVTYERIEHCFYIVCLWWTTQT